MDNKKLKADLIKLRDSVQDFLDNMDIDSAEKKPEDKKSEKDDKKPEKEDKED